ncbi:MAG: hypothetical protein ACLUIR_06755 [Faecalibacterium prausnitzii]
MRADEQQIVILDHIFYQALALAATLVPGAFVLAAFLCRLLQEARTHLRRSKVRSCAFMIISPFMKCFEKQGRCAAALFLALLSPGRIRKKVCVFSVILEIPGLFFCEKGII